MAICKLCQSNECDVDAHIIPRWAYSEMLRENPAVVASNNPDVHPFRSRCGDYDSELVCNSCERLFSECDNFAARFLRDGDWSQNSFTRVDQTQINPSHFYKEITDHSFPLLQHFVLSTLWKASASERHVWGGFSLGPKEELLRQYLLGEQEIGEHDFAFSLIRYFPTTAPLVLIPEQVLFTPLTGRWNGYWVARLSIPGFEFRISTDSRPSPLVPDVLRITENPSVVIGVPFELSRDMESLASIARVRNQARIRR
jgi:hypothetical protein